MKNEITNYLLIMILSGCLFLNFSSSFVKAQSLDNPLKDFGYTLKKSEKKKKDKKEKKDIPQQNQNITNENISTNDVANDDIIRVDTTMVLNEVLVFDKNGNYVNGLKQEDFIVKEDEQSQEISIFLTGDSEIVPRSVVLIIDYSFSQLPYVETSIEAAKVLVDKLNPNDRMAIVTDNVELLQRFTSDKVLLKEKLEALKNKALSGQSGSSKQYSALMATLNELFDIDSLRPIIIFQTDGDEFAELKGEVANGVFKDIETINFSYKELLTASEKKQATIYTVIPGFNFKDISEKEKLDRAKTELESAEKISAKLRNMTYTPNKIKIPYQSLKNRAEWLSRNQSAISEIAKLSGGTTDYLEEPEQADKIYSDILTKMNQRYVIGYYPTNQERNGKSRSIITEVRGHPEYKIVGRKRYILAEKP